VNAFFQKKLSEPGELINSNCPGADSDKGITSEMKVNKFGFGQYYQY